MRKSGILMHISSLPGPYGIGTMGMDAYKFVDFLEAAGQTLWQILPLAPTGYGDSPYQSISTFAGNPYFIDLDLLIQKGLLLETEVNKIDWGENGGKVDFGELFCQRIGLLKKAYSRFTEKNKLNNFTKENREWLNDYSLFMVLKEYFGYISWDQWPEEFRVRNKGAITEFIHTHEEAIYFYGFLQYEFYEQWTQLHAYAKRHGIEIIGDIPIYVPYDSSDVWSNPELFQLDQALIPTAVAGCPPDSFNRDGQLWGNPLYRWDLMEQQNYRWWNRRMAAASKLYDIVRLDHFRGFESYWSVPANAKTAAAGKWIKGPGLSFINAIRNANPGLRCIAEDLGYMTKEVKDLQEASKYPGMKVLQFAFDSREESDYLPHNYTSNSVCYTGTHDNATTVQWLHEATPEDIAMAKKYLGLSKEEGYIEGIIRGCMSSVSDTCIIPMQDFLRLGKSARMNQPGTMSQNNWSWRVRQDALTQELAEQIHEITKRYGRIVKR